MPAVQLARLKEQINQLAWNFTRPEEFRFALHDLLDLYADRTYRAGQAVSARPLSPSYHAPPLILRQLKLELGRLCEEHPAAALALVDLLWKDTFLEPRMLAAALLGLIPLQMAGEVLQRLQSWSNPDEDTTLLDALVEDGGQRIRRETPERWLELVENWLGDLSIEIQGLGLRALLPLIRDRSFENLPRVYRLISPIVQSAPAELQGELLEAVHILAQRSSMETAFFLRQMVSVSASAGTARLVRRCLPFFGEEAQISLKKALSNRPGAGR